MFEETTLSAAQTLLGLFWLTITFLTISGAMWLKASSKTKN